MFTLPILLYPLALVGLIGVPALVAIYLLRNRFRRQPVSSLMLWLDSRESREGGQRLRKLQTPLLFLLELLVLLLLVFSATDPQVRMSTGTRPLVVVLDDSFSMLAGGKDSPRERALAALTAEMRQHPPYSTRFILAGERPRLLGEASRSTAEALRQLDYWQCKSPVAQLDEALTLGAELGGDLATLLVLTDHKPATEVPDQGKLQWWAFGTARDNVAFVNAARSEREGLDRVLLEVANLGEQATSTGLVLEHLDGSKIIRQTSLTLPAGETQRLILQMPASTPGIRARIDDGVLPLDSEVILLPTPLKTVKVDLRLRDRRLREPIARAVTSSRLAEVTDDKPNLIFSDRGSEPGAGLAWVVSLVSEKDASSYSGPFVLDRTHPITEGLSLKSAVWGAGKTPTADGAPVVMAGNIPLVTDVELNTPSGIPRHELTLRFRADLSTVHDSPDWPILIWNILSWRSSALPGLSRQNLRLGDEVTLSLADYKDRVLLTPPGQSRREVSVKGRSINVRGDEVGLYELASEDQTYPFAVNALNRDESDLRLASTGRWGNWLDETALRLEYSGVSWLLLVLLLGLGVVHLLLMARARSVGVQGQGD